MGTPDTAGVARGPLISERQRARVSGFVARAAALSHVQVTTGGKAASGAGFFYQPTAIAGAQQTHEIVRKEVFGPVVSVTRCSDADEAIRWASDSD
jgi:aminobutyraldehyde dehydrogenase